MKRALIIFLLIFVCLTMVVVSSMAGTVRLNPKVKSTQTTNKPVSGQVALPVVKLDNISNMIVNGQPQPAIIKEWKLLLVQNPGMDVATARTRIIQKAILDWVESGNGLGSIPQSYNLQEMDLQQRMQREARMIQMMMNIMKAMHDTAEATIQNIR